MYYILCLGLISLWATYCLILRNGEPFVEVDTSYISHKTILHPHHSPLFGSMQLFHIESFLQCYNTAALLYVLPFVGAHRELQKKKRTWRSPCFLCDLPLQNLFRFPWKEELVTDNGSIHSPIVLGSLLKYTHDSIRGKVIHSMQLKSTFILCYFLGRGKQDC